MGNLILCHDRHAAHPYEITRIHCRIFTIEELCYYLCNNLYLIDYTIMNGQLCDWLDEELEMKALASELRDVLRLHGSVEKFVLTILKSSRLYREPEMIRIVYQAILNGEKDETVDEKFYGKIYASLGAAYGRLFLYQESAKMYDCAYQICGDKTLIKPYLYASYKYMSLEEYHILITKSEEYMEINAQMRREVDKINQEVSVEPEPGIMEKWKRSHRRSHA